MEVLARTVIRDVLESQSPAPADALQSQFLAFVAEKYSVAWKGYGKHGEAGRSLRERLIGRLHRFNITHFNRSPGERRLTPLLQALHMEPPESRYSTRCFLETVIEYASHQADVQEATEGPENSVVTGGRRYNFFSESNPPNGKFWRQSELSMACRVVFRTEGGLFLGLGPADMRAGDEVWVLAGADTPVILRPLAMQRHSFVGEAFVYGMMHGQALKLFPYAQDVVLE